MYHYLNIPNSVFLIPSMAQKLQEGAPGEQEQIWWIQLEISQLINAGSEENSVWMASIFYHNQIIQFIYWGINCSTLHSTLRAVLTAQNPWCGVIFKMLWSSQLMRKKVHLEMNGFFHSNIIYLPHFRFLYLANVVLNVQKLLKKNPQN